MKKKRQTIFFVCGHGMSQNEIKNNDGLVSLVLSMPMLYTYISFMRLLCHNEPHERSIHSEKKKKRNGIEIKCRMHLYPIHYGIWYAGGNLRNSFSGDVCATVYVNWLRMCGIGSVEFCAKQINFIFVRYPNRQNMAFTIFFTPWFSTFFS